MCVCVRVCVMYYLRVVFLQISLTVSRTTVVDSIHICNKDLSINGFYTTDP